MGNDKKVCWPVVKAVQASQIRRNEAAKVQRNRENAKRVMMHYFSILAKKEQNEQSMVARRL